MIKVFLIVTVLYSPSGLSIEQKEYKFKPNSNTIDSCEAAWERQEPEFRRYQDMSDKINGNNRYNYSHECRLELE